MFTRLCDAYNLSVISFQRERCVAVVADDPFVGFRFQELERLLKEVEHNTSAAAAQ